MKQLSQSKIAVMLIWLGIALHIYTIAFKTEGAVNMFLVGLFFWSCLPYFVTALLALFAVTRVVALGAATAAVVADGVTHYLVFVAPQGSTAALGLLWAPLWNLMAFGPIGALLAYIFHRLASKAHAL